MATAEGNHWWYRALHNLVLNTLMTHLDSKEIRILDAGCGTGGLLQKLTSAGYKNVTGFDLSDYALDWCVRRGLSVQKFSLMDLDLFEAPKKYDAIISNDTLCYLSLPEQYRFINSSLNRLNLGGVLIMNLPALNAFRGTHDLAVGIMHRFNRAQVGNLASANGLEIVSDRYWPVFLSPVIFAVRSCQRVWQARGAKRAVQSSLKSDLRLHSAIVNDVLYYLTISEFCFSIPSHFGSSLFVVLKKSSKTM